MSRKKKHRRKQHPLRTTQQRNYATHIAAEKVYERACRLAVVGRSTEARTLFEQLDESHQNRSLRARIENNLATLDAIAGNFCEARHQWEHALEIDKDCAAANSNLALLKQAVGAPCPHSKPDKGTAYDEDFIPTAEPPIKVALLSLLFNWPATGGGNIHTVELAKFLAQADYEVRHFFAKYPAWELGRIHGNCPFPSEAISFNDATWNRQNIKTAFRDAVRGFDPDYVIITDSWNMKPLLAAAVDGYPFFLRMQASECLCPLNNLRIQPVDGQQFRYCPHHQLTSTDACHDCLHKHGLSAGGLHQAERALAGVGTPEYTETLHRSLQQTEAVLVLNLDIAELYRPYSRRVEVVTWGMDEKRFPWPVPESKSQRHDSSPAITTLLFAGLLHEFIKGYHVLREAGRLLWNKRQDFQLLVTGDEPDNVELFERFVGWHTQDTLPELYRAADICVVPTIVPDGLSRTAVEAMASGRPVVASRIGGLPYTVEEGVNGLLCEPGNAADLADKLEQLLDDPLLRRHMGTVGRRRFEERFTWERVIEGDYRNLLARKRSFDGHDSVIEAQSQPSLQGQAT